MDERPPMDAELPGEESNPEWGNTDVDRCLAQIHVTCGRAHPTMLAQRLREAGYPGDNTQRARPLYCELREKHTTH
eukprot:6129455-Lingulodinium_polyedra.AAC.1